MAANTKNYNLVKPAENELADISVINKNMDTIDEQMMPINDLNSRESKKSLAAMQGKILNEKIGELNGLTTEHKDNLVQAINEAAEKDSAIIITKDEIDITDRKNGAIYWFLTEQQASVNGDIKVSPTMGIKVV